MLDAEQSFRSGDCRFVGTVGIEFGVPGLYPSKDPIKNQENRKMIQQYGTKTITGTSDAIHSQIQDEVCKAAKKYAEVYNARLLQLNEK